MVVAENAEGEKERAAVFPSSTRTRRENEGKGSRRQQKKGGREGRRRNPCRGDRRDEKQHEGEREKREQVQGCFHLESECVVIPVEGPMRAEGREEIHAKRERESGKQGRKRERVSCR